MSRLISVSDGTPPPVYLWKLSPDLSGGGVWSQESLASSQFSSKPAQFHRPELGCSATIADTSFYIGGIVSTQSDPTAVSLPGTYLYETTVTSFNSSSGLWGDEATASLNSVGTSIGAKAVAVPAIGLDQRALIFVLGGWDPGFNINQPPTDYVGLDNVTLYDPYIERWYSQKATGDIPAPRGHFCAVAMPSDNGTYEM